MKLGEVLRKERESRGVSLDETAAALGVSAEQLEAIEGGKDGELERVAALVLRFNELVEGQVSQLFYPCGIPFTTIRGYDASR